MRQAEVEILRISSFLMVFFYRRFLPLDVFIYAFGAENDASSSNLPIPLIKTGSMKSAFGGINPSLTDEI